MTVGELLAAWGSILNGRAPMLSIEITRECPLSCPGCYAYGDFHLGGGKKLTELSDLRGEALVEGVLDWLKKHRPLHVSLVGGEPMIRHRELSKILPALSQQNIFTMVVTSGIIPIPEEWMGLRRNRVAVSDRRLPEATHTYAAAHSTCSASMGKTIRRGPSNLLSGREPSLI